MLFAKVGERFSANRSTKRQRLQVQYRPLLLLLAVVRMRLLYSLRLKTEVPCVRVDPVVHVTVGWINHGNTEIPLPASSTRNSVSFQNC